jgi:coenzyme PQQ precursor peptide PqqA
MESVAARSHPVEWESPDFEEIGCAAEVTMYVARLED